MVGYSHTPKVQQSIDFSVENLEKGEELIEQPKKEEKLRKRTKRDRKETCRDTKIEIRVHGNSILGTGTDLEC